MNFSWPILPPPKSTPGQLFGANKGKHQGLDMGTGGDVVLAPAAGTVTAMTTVSDSRGRLLYIDHGTDDEGNTWQTRYYHLASASVKKDDPVTAGMPIAVAGMAGLPKPHPHLHFEVRRNGVAIDPYTILPDGEVLRAAAKNRGILPAAALVASLWFALR